MILKFMTVLAIGLFSSLSFADRLPVDDEIDGLRFKAQHLEDLKVFLQKNLCSATVNGNKVVLSAGALRSEALVIGIAPENPGNYNAFHKAPKPRFLNAVMRSDDARVVAVKFLFNEKLEKVALQTKIGNPEYVNPGDEFWHYMNASYKMNLDTYYASGSEGRTGEFKTPYGDELILSCKPKN